MAKAIPTTSSRLPSWTGRREKPASMATSRALGHRQVGLDRPHVGARHHDLAHDGVAEPDDGVDELALVGLDDLLLRMATSAMASSSDSRMPARLAVAGAHEEVGQAVEPGGEDAHGREGHQRRDDGRHEERGALGVVDGPVLGQRLGQDEDDHDLEEGGGQHPEGAEEPLRQDAHQSGGDQLADEHEQEDRVQERLGVLDQAHEPARSPAALVAQRQRLGLAGARQGRLGQRQQGRPHQQDDHHHHEDDVGRPEVPGGEHGCGHHAPRYEAAR